MGWEVWCGKVETRWEYALLWWAWKQLDTREVACG